MLRTLVYVSFDIACDLSPCKLRLPMPDGGRGLRKSLRQQWRDSIGADIDERTDEVSADLPYELQSKMFDQLAAVSVAGAALTVTLIGSLLRDAPPVVWLPVILFGSAALLAVSGNIKLIDGLFAKRPTLIRSKIYTTLAVMLIGMAIGALSMSVYYDGKRDLPSSILESQP